MYKRQGILAWAVVFGLALRKSSDKTKSLLSDISDAVTQAVRWVISFAPFGIMGLMYNSVSTSGASIFSDYGKLLALLLGCMVFVALVINPLIVFLNIKQNPYPLVFKCLKDSGITAFCTRSSAANIPVNMELCKNLGLNEDNYSVSIPLGATINMGGAAAVSYTHLGSKNLDKYIELIKEKKLIARVLPTSEVLESCEGLGLNADNIIAMKGPFSEEMNIATYKQYNIDLLITKESGVAGGFLEKINACKVLNIPVIIISRKKIDYPKVINNIEDIEKMI